MVFWTVHNYCMASLQPPFSTKKMGWWGSKSTLIFKNGISPLFIVLGELIVFLVCVDEVFCSCGVSFFDVRRLFDVDIIFVCV